MRTNNEILALTGIRAFAAYGVLLTHFHGELCALVPNFEVLAPVYTRGGLGVDLFFILSGFIITHVYGRGFAKNSRQAYAPYLVNRFARIYPNYFVSLTFLVFLVGIGKLAGITVQGDYSWTWLPAHYLMLQPLPGVPGGWNFPSWSIGAEFFAYLIVFPVFIRVFQRCHLSPTQSFILSPVFLLLFWIPKLLGCWGAGEHLPMVTSEFLCGAFLRSACTEPARIRLWLGRLLPLTLLLLTLLIFLPLPVTAGWDRMGIVLLFPAFLGGLFGSAGRIAGFFALSPIVYLGHTSYALYLVHAIVQKILKATVLTPALHSGSPFVRNGVFVLYLVLPLAAASLLYHLVEEPCRKWIRARWKN